MADKITKITIMNAVVFDKEVRQAGNIIDVTDATRADAEALIKRGRAVAGAAQKKIADPANKAVTQTETRT